MKKLLLILLAATLFVSCSSDDDIPPPDDKPYYNPVEGKWKRTINENDYSQYEFTSGFIFNSILYQSNQYTYNSRGYRITNDSIYLYWEDKSFIGVVSYNIVSDTLFYHLPFNDGHIQIQKYTRIR